MAAADAAADAMTYVGGQSVRGRKARAGAYLTREAHRHVERRGNMWLEGKAGRVAGVSTR